MGGAPVSARRPSSFDQSHLPNIWQESHLWSRNDWPEPQIIAPHSRGLTCRQTGKPMDTHVSLDVVIFGLGHHSTLEIDGVSPLQVRVTTVNGRHLSVVSKIHKNAVWDHRLVGRGAPLGGFSEMGWKDGSTIFNRYPKLLTAFCKGTWLSFLSIWVWAPTTCTTKCFCFLEMKTIS